MAGGGYSRMQIMEIMEERIKEMEDLGDDLLEDKDDLEEMNLIEEDEDYLMNLERYRRKKEKASLKGSGWEPSLVVCWTIVFIVTLYVIFLIITGGKQNDVVRDEL